MSKEDTLKDLLQELAEQRGFDFRGYKRTTLERRFRKRMFQLSMGSYAEYGEYIRRHGEEVNELLTTILINVTEFFRDPPAWEVLRNDILPPILKKLKPGSSFRVWSAGCASGEEPYSVAMILAEHFGPKISEYDVKIYATDIDDEELNTARRGEYSPEAIKRVRAEWRDKYFFSKGTYRINRELRKLVIFGKSNLAQHAPISHVDLLLCRNVLIYFDSTLQKHILSRLHYALEPGGILFLGRSESQLTNSIQFQRLNARWRIFRRLTPSATMEPRVELLPAAENGENGRSHEEVVRLRLHQRYLMESLRAGAIILGADDTIVQHNSAILSLYGLTSANLTGKKLQDTDIPMRTPELVGYLTATLANNESARFQSRLRLGPDERLLDFTVRPLMNDRGERTGTLIYCEDSTVQEKLQTTIEELESTTEELQSANEELETTNEELQSTNEELETTNEELQSTNEELETTNEELQSLNEELETTNQELEERTKELDQLNGTYAQTLEKIRLPVMLVNPDGRIDFWNAMALRLFGFRSKPPVELQLEQLPVPEPLRKLIIRRHRMALAKREPMVARNVEIGGRVHAVDVHFSVIPQENRSHSVLLMFEPREGPAERTANASAPRPRRDGNRRK